MMNRLFGVGREIEQHWLDFLPVSLALTLVVLISCLLAYHRASPIAGRAHVCTAD